MFDLEYAFLKYSCIVFGSVDNSRTVRNKNLKRVSVKANIRVSGRALFPFTRSLFQ